MKNENNNDSNKHEGEDEQMENEWKGSDMENNNKSLKTAPTWRVSGSTLRKVTEVGTGESTTLYRTPPPSCCPN